MPLMPRATGFDTFSRQLTDSWGNADSGQAWLGETSIHDSFYTAATLGYGRVAVSSTDKANKIVYLDTTASSDQEVLVKMKWNTDNTTDNGPILRNVAGSSSNYYYTTLIDSLNQVKIGVYKNGVRTVLATASKTFAKDTWYWVRTQITGTTFRSRVWADGVVEPGTWDVSTTISATTGPASGKPGFRTQSEGTAHYVYIDTFYSYNETLSDLSLPVTDTFTRNIHQGAGLADTGHHWLGHVSDDPFLYATQKTGYVTSSNGYLQFTANNTLASDPRGMIGPDSTDVEVYCKVYCDVATSSPTIRVGARAVDGTASGAFDYGAGEVYVRLVYGSTTLELFRDTTSLGTLTITAPGAGEIWHIRFQVQGTTARAKAWKDGTSEPGSYTLQATSIASIASTGKAWWRNSRAAAGDAVFRFYDFTVTQLTNNNALTVGSLSTSNLTDTSVDVAATYTLDNNNDSSITIQYKKATEGTWTTAASPSVNRGTRTFSKSITGLLQGTDYNIRVTYADADGVNGVNPLTTNITTTLNGTDTERVDLSTTTTLGQVLVKGYYKNDADNDNSATYAYRTVGTPTISIDNFIDVTGKLLELHKAGTGNPDETFLGSPSWSKNATGTLTINESGYVYPNSAVNDSVYAFSEVSPVDPVYTVEGTIRVVSLEGYTGFATRMQNGTNYYYAYYTVANDGEWHFGKCISGVKTDFYTISNVLLKVGDQRVVRIVENGNSHTLYIGETVSTLQYIYSATDSSITNAYTGGLITGVKSATIGQGILIEDFKQTILGTLGAWSSAVTLATQTNEPTIKYRSGTITGLSNNTYYEVRVTFTDPDGVRNLNPQSNMILTPGSGVAFDAVPISVTAYDTTAVVAVNYIFDTNENSSIDVQYKSIRDLLWTSVNSGVITTNRGTKKFYVTLNHLIPNLAYQVRVVLNDSDGITFGPNEATASFNTQGAIIDANTRGKHYLYKVYGLDGEFINTWPDAPEPSFEWHENGGLSDLTVDLPRKFSSVNTDPTLDFGHRVDVWAIDTSPNGMGSNMVTDNEMNLGSWTLTTSWTVDATGGPDESSSLKFSSGASTLRRVQSETIDLPYNVPLVTTMVARAVGGKLRMDMAAYDASDVLLDTSDDNAETIGSNWQTIRLEWLPPAGTAYVRIRVENVGAGTMWFDKVSVVRRELLIYRGFIESYKASFDDKGEQVSVEVISLASQLSDYYVQFLQFDDIQPSRDADEYFNQNKQPDDPSNMMKRVIDMMQADNPRCGLYYTGDSIKLTGTIAKYTFREQRAEDVFDDIRNLCPSGWHWFIDPDGLVHLRGSEHATEHVLRLNVEAMSYDNNRTIGNLKNYVIVRGRKDEDESEPDGQGTIEYRAFDQDSIDRYGLRISFVRDANIKDNDTAELVGNGRLEEWNTVEEEGEARIPDEKDIRYVGGALGGYNIESFKPGDEIRMLDPIGDGRSFWDQFLWDDGTWDDNVSRILPQDNPIKTIRYRGHEVLLNLSNRPPSSTGDHAKFLRWLRQQEEKSND